MRCARECGKFTSTISYFSCDRHFSSLCLGIFSVGAECLEAVVDGVSIRRDADKRLSFWTRALFHYSLTISRACFHNVPDVSRQVSSPSAWASLVLRLLNLSWLRVTACPSLLLQKAQIFGWATTKPIDSVPRRRSTLAERLNLGVVA